MDILEGSGIQGCTTIYSAIYAQPNEKFSAENENNIYAQPYINQFIREHHYKKQYIW